MLHSGEEACGLRRQLQGMFHSSEGSTSSDLRRHSPISEDFFVSLYCYTKDSWTHYRQTSVRKVFPENDIDAKFNLPNIKEDKRF